MNCLNIIYNRLNEWPPDTLREVGEHFKIGQILNVSLPATFIGMNRPTA